MCMSMHGICSEEGHVHAKDFCSRLPQTMVYVYINKNRLLPSSSSTDSSPQLANLILGENSTAEAKMINYWILLKGLLIRKKLANFHLIGGDCRVD